jgi:hypothetical protein
VAGPAPGTFTVPASTGTVTANLNGTGIAAQMLTISPVRHDFGSVLVGLTSATHTFTIGNPNTVSVPITTITTTGPFSVTSTTCGGTIGPSAVCTASAHFAPLAHGTVNGNLVVDTTGTFPGHGASSKSFGTSTTILTGTGLLQSSLEMPSSVDMGSGTLGGPPIRRSVPLANGGNAALTLESISIARPFTLTHDCPLNLLPGRSCTVNLELEATTLGTFNGSLFVFSNAPDGVRSTPVRATVQARPEPVIKVSPLTIGFGDRMAGTRSAPQRITVTNEGGGDAIGVSVGVNTPHFLVVGTTCGQTILSQSTCFADVLFAPQGFGPRRDTFFVRSSNDPASPATTNVSGAGCRPVTITSSRGGPAISCAP